MSKDLLKFRLLPLLLIIVGLSLSSTVSANSNQVSKTESKLDYMNKFEQIMKPITTSYAVWGTDFMSLRYNKSKEKATLLNNARDLESEAKHLITRTTNLRPPNSLQSLHGKLTNLAASWHFAMQLWVAMVEDLKPENIGSPSATAKVGRNIQGLLKPKVEEVSKALEKLNN